MDKPYYTLNDYLKSTYGKKCFKVSVNAGLTCPNRDGTLDSRGCIFCSASGSGDFACNISSALQTVRDNSDNNYIVYFQAFTNTYGDIDYLESIYRQALAPDNVIGISIGTRPDCLSDSVMELLTTLQNECSESGKFIWIELGLQTIHEHTAKYIRRHYALSVYDEAVAKLNDCNIPYITHIILGLPNETPEMMLDTVSYVCSKNPFGIKLQLLHVLEHTDLADDYNSGLFETMTMDEYIDIVISCLRIIPPQISLHRVTGDGPKDILISPRWSTNKKVVLNTLHKKMWKNGYTQGDLYL